MWPPVIYLLLEHVGPIARHSSACPPQHMKALATAVLDGGKWVPDGKVFCVYVCVWVCCHIKECFYCTSFLSHIPGVMWGRLLQDGGGCVCVANCMWMHVCCPQSSWCALDMCACVHAYTCTRVLTIPALYCRKTLWTPRQQQNFTTIQSTNCHCSSTYVLRHTYLIQLKGYWLFSCKKLPSCC